AERRELLVLAVRAPIDERLLRRRLLVRVEPQHGARAVGDRVAADLASAPVVGDELAVRLVVGVRAGLFELAALPLVPHAVALPADVRAFLPLAIAAIAPLPPAVALARLERALHAQHLRLAPQRVRSVEAALLVVLLLRDQHAHRPDRALSATHPVRER